MSKEAILKLIRQNKPENNPSSKSEIHGSNELFEKLIETFIRSLELAGADVVALNNEGEAALHIKDHLKDALDFTDPDVWAEYGDECQISKLDRIGTAILKGSFGVAENGAIWMDESGFPNRLVPFIAQKLVILLAKENIVENMHSAYGKIDFTNTGFGVFVSGPSKTADIEQSLVYGAHGPKKVWVIMY